MSEGFLSRRQGTGTGTNPELFTQARRLPSMPLPEAVPPPHLRSSVTAPRRHLNSNEIAERRRRRRNQREQTASSPRVAPIPLHLLQQSQESAQSLLSPRQIMCVGNYDLGRTIGKGQFGKVKVATHVLTGEKVAVKIIQKKKLKGDQFDLVRKEIEILKAVQHPNIVKLYEVLETDRVVFLILELASGGEALDFVVIHGRLSEEKARLFMRQIVSAMSYCHDHFIAHRDLKGENLLLDDDLNIKVIDFGLSTIFKPGELLNTYCGSPAYAAPELLKKQPYHGPAADVWSIGVTLYVFVCGILPFKGTPRELYDKVTNGDYTIPDHLSSECKDLLRSLLCVNQDVRATMAELKAHPWMVANDGWQVPSYEIEPPTVTKDTVDMSIIREMEFFGFKPSEVLDSLLKKSYDPASATFNLLRSKKDKNVVPSSRPRRLTDSGPAYLTGIVSMPNSTSTSPCAISPRESKLPSPLSHTAMSRSPHYVESPSSSPYRPPNFSRVQSQLIQTKRTRSISSETSSKVTTPEQPRRKRSTSDKEKISPPTLLLTPERSQPSKLPAAVTSTKPAERPKLLEPVQPLPSGLTQFQRARTVKSRLAASDGMKQHTEQKQEQEARLAAERNVNLRSFKSSENISLTGKKPKSKPTPITKPVWEDNQLSPLSNAERVTSRASFDQNLRRREDSRKVTASELFPSKDTQKEFSDRVKTLSEQLKALRRGDEENATNPRTLRSAISGISMKDPQDILQEIKAYFKEEGIPYESVGTYALKALHIEKSIRFEIEVCTIPNLQGVYSVRMQRVSGDWETYAQFCTECLSRLNLSLSPVNK